MVVDGTEMYADYNNCEKCGVQIDCLSKLCDKCESEEE